MGSAGQIKSFRGSYLAHAYPRKQFMSSLTVILVISILQLFYREKGLLMYVEHNFYFKALVQVNNVELIVILMFTYFTAFSNNTCFQVSWAINSSLICIFLAFINLPKYLCFKYQIIRPLWSNEFKWTKYILILRN